MDHPVRALCLLATLACAAFAQEPAAELRAAVSKSGVPGAVVAIARTGQDPIVLVEGDAARVPARRPMRRDAIFDMASLTKPIATATSILLLVEDGRIGLDDPVARHWPEFGRNGKEPITVRHLLHHRGGLIADNPLRDYEQGVDEALRRIAGLPTVHEPGTRFLYTDVGFIVLGILVERVSGTPLDRFAAERIFAPLGMKDTFFVREGSGDDPARKDRFVPTEPASAGAPPLVGKVHDPRARALGGVAGHAGLFSTVDDLLRYARCLLEGGLAEDGRRVLAPSTARLLGDAGTLPRGERRGHGFDVDTGFSGPRGPHMGRSSFGHTGFTGTSMWIDPKDGLVAIALTSRLHPDGKGDVRELRRAIGRIAWTATHPVVKTGLDRLLSGAWPDELQHKRIGLITNHTGVDGNGRRNVDLLAGREDLSLVRLFSPEHGLEGKKDERVGHAVDGATGLPVFSLYGEHRKPTPESLEGVDALVFDIQDIGARFYTYISTLVLAGEAADERGIPLVVLDRPNAIGGAKVEGPIADEDALDFVGCLRIPVRHGMTTGEIARFAARVKGWKREPLVIGMEGWRRTMLFSATGLPWVNPSPNMRSEDAALLYPGVGMLETTNISVGRGTPTPFLVVGAPWIDGAKLAGALNETNFPGLLVHPWRFTPDASVHARKECGGIRLTVTDPDDLEPVSFGFALATALRKLHPDDWDTKKLDRLLKCRAAADLLRSGRTPPSADGGGEAYRDFLERRGAALLYPE